MLKFEMELVGKQEISPDIFLIVFKSDTEVEAKPGQFLSLEVAPKEFRSYSLVCDTLTLSGEVKKHIDLPNLSKGRYIVFLVSVRTGGKGSHFFDTVQIGARVNTLGPLGRFAIIPSDKPKMFLASGTGIAPFIWMVQELLNADPKAAATVVFGSLSASQNFALPYFEVYQDKRKYPNFKFYTVLYPEKVAQETEFVRNGFLHEQLPSLTSDYQNTEFYLCGNPLMIEGVVKVLDRHQAPVIVKEEFGAPKPKA